MLPLPTHFTTTLLKAYLQELLLSNTSCQAIKKKRGGEAEFEVTEQASKPDVTGMWEHSDQEFKTIINMLRALMDKVHSIQEQMNSLAR